MGYFGSKATSGLCQPLIAMMPPHDTYIETHLGGGAIMRRKPAALHNIGIDRDARALGEFECDYRVELIHGCAHRFLSEYAFEGSELLYSDPPYLRHTRTSKVLSVDACGRCGEDLTDAACLGHERRTLIDIVFEKVVRHADAQIKHCPRCHAETRACFPHQMPGPLQYGPGIKAYVVHLLIAQMLSLKRVAQSMHALIGRTLSEATLLGYVAQLHHALAEWESHAIERLLAMPAMHVDETSLRVDRKNHWIHVYSAGTLTVKCLHPKRG